MIQRVTIDPEQFSVDKVAIALSAEQTHYLTRVLRLKAGDRFIAQDGTGSQWLAAIAQQSQQANVIEKLSAAEQPPANLRLIAALTKGNSFDAVVRQATELGITHLHPVITARTILKPSANKITRWKRIAQEASEQSERVTVPEILAPVTFQTSLAHIEQACLEQTYIRPDSVKLDSVKPDSLKLDSTKQNSVEQNSVEQNSIKADSAQPQPSLRFICAARANQQKTENNSPILKSNYLLSRLLFHQQTLPSSASLPSITIAIGPEGGWTTEEITVATTYNYEVVSLGPAILRAVTAPITALSLVTAARELLI